VAASAFEFYNNFKHQLMLGNVPLDGTGVVFNMHLFTSASNAATAALSGLSSVTNEVATGGYALRALTVNLSVRATTSTFSWLFATVIWTVAAASAMANVRYAVIVQQTASILICWTELSTAEFSVAAGNLYVIEPNPVAFTLN
jgi:hypothetical protein